MHFPVFCSNARGMPMSVSSPSSPATWRTRRRWIRFFRLFLFALVVTLAIAPALFGFLATYFLLHPSCGETRETPGDYGLAWEDVVIEASAGGQFSGYFVPGTNGAVIIMPPAYGGGRGSRLAEASVLARHGYAVFTYESRRCADMGAHSLGYKETREVADALDYVQGRDDVDADRVGLLGFSSAGATSVMAAAQLPAIQAVVAEGGYGDFAAETLGHSNPLEAYVSWTMRLSYRLLTGVDVDKLSATDAIPNVAPRPVLLIYGSTEASLKGARSQLAAAQGCAELWIVEGAGHGNYHEVAPDEYETRVVDFFDRYLRP